MGWQGRTAAGKPHAHFFVLAATAGGIGTLPVAPGTWGSLIALPLSWLLAPAGLLVYLSVTLALFLAGVAICGRAAAAMGNPDPPAIVYDEIVGQLLTLAGHPVTLPYLVTGFVLFRAMDILKPYPINRIDSRWHGGLGIMLDDALAGFYAWLGLMLAAKIWFT